MVTEYGSCPAFGYQCEYVAKVEAQAAEIEKLRLECQAQYDRGYFDGRQYDGAEERAKIVAWLRESADWHDTHDDGLSGFDRIAQADRESANLIEAKDHLK
jgi:hypothetical protein